jgi:hypothetical protein
MVFYVLYGWGSYWADDSDRVWWTVTFWYVVAALLTAAFSSACVFYAKSQFWSAEEDQEEPQGQLWATFVGAGGVFLALLAAQLCLAGLAYRPEHAGVWVVSFSLISTSLAAFGTYFFIGDPGMANLASLDERFGRQSNTQGSAGDLPKGLMDGLEAELAMLRDIAHVLITSYAVVIAGVLLGLDRIAVLLGASDFHGVSFGGQIWFIVGVALLLVSCHASVTGPVYSRYYVIARWLRRSGITRARDNAGLGSAQAVEGRSHER